jgi:hypothetical protein
LAEMMQTMTSGLFLKYQHSWAGHLMRLSDQHPAKLLVQARDGVWWEAQKLLDNPILRSQRGRPCEWEYKLVEVHGLYWKSFCQDRNGWKIWEEAFVHERQWDLGHDMGYDLMVPLFDKAYQASFWDTLGAQPERGTLKGIRVILATCSDELVGACLGQVRGAAEQRALYSRLAQAHFILTGHCGVSMEGFDSILLRVEEDANPAVFKSRCAALCGESERVSHSIVPVAGDTLIGYHSGRGATGKGACAFVVLLWPSSGEAPIVVESCTMQAPVQDNNEGLSLLLLMRACIGIGQFS